MLIEPGKGQVRELLAGLGESLCADQALKIGLIGEMSKKRVELGLNAGFETRDHGDQENWKRQCALASECLRLQAGLFEEFGGVQEPYKVLSNRMEFKASWVIALNIK